MIEFTIHGRGGQGGVTLAKLIATAYFLRGKHVQAFGVYAAERSGAPLQAFVRVDDGEIVIHNQVRTPDHVVVLDHTLIGPSVLAGARPDGWLILNVTHSPHDFDETYPGRSVATIDATGIAVANGLGTKAVPIVNTTMLGAVARVLDLSFDDVRSALSELKFAGPNLHSAQAAFERVRTAKLPGFPQSVPIPAQKSHVAGFLDDDVGGLPLIRTGSWSTRRPERRELTPPCNHTCPAGNDVQGFIQALARGDADVALQTLLETSPLPGVCGRVCPAPCMDECNRRLYDEAINVRELERYAADHGRRPTPNLPWRHDGIAIVGSGPAGLACAYHLARLGYPATLIDRASELGGVLRYGIPEYRLPRAVLEEEISHIRRHGVEARTNFSVGRAALLDLTREFSAVFVATGLQHSQSLRLVPDAPKDDDDNDDALERRVWQGVTFLERVRDGGVLLDGERVVVVGGGNTAIDAARTARRVGARSVHIVYRRAREQMPAIRDEIEEALDEGVVLDELTSPLRLHYDGTGLVLTCQRMRLGPPDETGRPRPIPETTEDAQFEMSCDRVILALGQSADLSILPEGAAIHEGRLLHGLAAAPVFFGGDFATNEGTVAAAIGSGRRAAWHIHRSLTGEDLFPKPRTQIAGPEHVTMHIFSHGPRHEGWHVPAELRRASFTEVRLGLQDEPGSPAAMHEAQRCFSCGVCNQCDRCLSYCPEGIIRREGVGYRFDYDYCKGCGICAAQCPRGVVYLEEL